jgi:hypothetical protein
MVHCVSALRAVAIHASASLTSLRLAPCILPLFVAHIFERDSRVLLDPAQPAPHANARRGDGEGFPCHGCS